MKALRRPPIPACWRPGLPLPWAQGTPAPAPRAQGSDAGPAWQRGVGRLGGRPQGLGRPGSPPPTGEGWVARLGGLSATRLGVLYGLCLAAPNSLVGNKVLPARPFQTFHSVETVFKKNERIFLPKHAVSPLGRLMPAVHQKEVRPGLAPVPGARVVQGPPACLLPGGSGNTGTSGSLWRRPSPRRLEHAAADPLWAPPWCWRCATSAVPTRSLPLLVSG